MYQHHVTAQNDADPVQDLQLMLISMHQNEENVISEFDSDMVVC